MVCDVCEREIPDHAQICPHCRQLPMSPRQRSAYTLRVLGVFAACIGIVVLVMFYQYVRHGIVPHTG